MKNIKKRPLIILDFGSQYTQLIGRRVREMGVYCEIYPYHVDDKILQKLTPCGVILSGGPSTVTEATNPRAPQWVFELGVPLLGICYGMQTMAAQLGGHVASSPIREFGYAELTLHGDSPLLNHIEDRESATGESLLDVWMSHGDKVITLPPGFSMICQTKNAPIAGMADESRHWYGLQFHPEVTHTLQGSRILQRPTILLKKP
jgi:GMP synthase (glutamine-hydrolysing)